ncbi:hypothetical protein P775_06025 [Puniceibacterium antarcticum]|uniref:Cytochrome c domain-containing protein n=1 Tax=Puniceibacterium antarcticum TaxID=1206336 RepID=A0A2G8RI73_9RHOB|nr:cytochrome C [Puniceibacterium antarcticum]PIL21101.1 hypothetical protein P775_06025 [Puniceibacterium antarcticum]
MKLKLTATFFLATMASSAFAASHTGSGDAEAGAKIFNQCKACHSITADDGTDVVRGGKIGPNLYGVIGRPVASIADFRYGDGIKALGETGMVWDEESFVAYVQDPTAFLDEKLGDTSARSKMAFKLRKGMEDVYAYLVSVGPAM